MKFYIIVFHTVLCRAWMLCYNARLRDMLQYYNQAQIPKTERRFYIFTSNKLKENHILRQNKHNDGVNDTSLQAVNCQC